MAREVFVLDPADNVATLVSENGSAGRVIEVERQGKPLSITLRQNVPFGHKFALERIAQGQPVIKYGHTIGTASRDLEPGDHVHVHNIESNRGRGDLAAKAKQGAQP
jgi:altronate dehydratase small subunit